MFVRQKQGITETSPQRKPFVRTNERSVLPQFATDADYVLSAVHIELEGDSFDGVIARYPGDDEFQKMKKERPDVFVYRYRYRPAAEGLLMIPLEADTKLDGVRSLMLDEHLPAIRALIAYRLPHAMPQFELQRRRFCIERVNREYDILDLAFKRSGLIRTKAYDGFHKFQRVGLNVQIIGQPDRPRSLCMTMRVNQKYELEVPLHELVKRDFDLRGCWVYDPAKHGRDKWLGCVKKIDGAWIVVEGEGGVKNLPMKGSYEYRIDPRRDTFGRLLGQKLGGYRLTNLERAEEEVLAENLSGDGYLRKLRNQADMMKRQGTLEAAPSVRFRFTGLVDAARSSQAHCIRTTQYCFSDDGTKTDPKPSNGLERFGPVTPCNDTPVILIVYPEESWNEVKHFVGRLLDGHEIPGPLRRGFLETFGFSDSERRRIAVASGGGTGAEADCYVNAIREGWNPDARPDIALVFQRQRGGATEARDPYLATKAFLLSHGVPSQEILMATVQKADSQLPYVFESIAIAMHAKLGGTPWTVVPAEQDVREIVIGMAHAETTGARFAERKRYMGITTVFSNDGTYLLRAKTGRCRYEDYPAELERSIKETVATLQKEQAWHAGERVRVIVHTRMPLRNTNVVSIMRTAMRELRAGIKFQIACLTVHRGHQWRVVEPKQPGQPRSFGPRNGPAGTGVKGERVPMRGTIIDLGANKWLVCLKDPTQILRASAPIPQPISIELHPESKYDDMMALATQVLDFSGLSWSSVRSISEPVTTYYAHLIAEKLNQLEGVEGWSDHALDTQLARRVWFL